MSSSVRSRPCFTIFGGPNGSGKSTAYDRFLQAGFDSGEYLNPDEIAKSLNAGAAAGSAIDLRAGREVVQRTRSLIDDRRSLVRESTLTSREIVRSAERAKAVGYRLVMVFVGVFSTDMTRGRVALRVARGGHDIPAEAQERRFPRSFENAPKVARLVDVAYFLDNTGLQHRLVAAVSGGTITFLDPQEVGWVERATMGLPRAATLKSRDEALADLRETEGLSEELQVREQRPGYVSV
ncbi:MAG: zeta toxin family protein [Gammaproteobacteria bacterium]|nr:zeta toxin family protein [Gammaproteobacteria bacterium]